MARRPSLQVGNVVPDHQPVEPGGCEIELGICGQGVGAIEEPTASVPHGDATVASGVAEKGNEVHLRNERKADSIETEPS